MQHLHTSLWSTPAPLSQPRRKPMGFLLPHQALRLWLQWAEAGSWCLGTQRVTLATRGGHPTEVSCHEPICNWHQAKSRVCVPLGRTRGERSEEEPGHLRKLGGSSLHRAFHRAAPKGRCSTTEPTLYLGTGESRCSCPGRGGRCRTPCRLAVTVSTSLCLLGDVYLQIFICFISLNY